MTYDQRQMDDLYRRVMAVLGREEFEALIDMKPRGDAFNTALSRAIKAMSGPDKVTDEQILGALEIADEVFPVELGVITRAYYGKPEG